ncbi:FAD/NAD(P)-binding domain-containing protein [Pseudonocardia sp. KRD291]|uniref:FAD/NAD(P)-binding protein n=1 Tax=Pseudonocardia sp. KRD291 TaxID=2792007 RepID=UPI001C4A0414|nr:FAD/NAD(P)-binding protein [Pseudonocardia sp. KRD291]MBW0106789.1 FAD/NAD(P)-binding protein [Pseudonocardia sp. KRD291]
MNPPTPTRRTDAASAVAIVGAGPRGAGILERLVASAPELHADALAGPGLDVHLIDPYPAGAGRIWRHEQSPLLAMNSMAADVTMYTDDSVVCDGPIVHGPSFWDWAQDLRDNGDPEAELGAELAAELAEVTASTFPSRRLQSHYLCRVLRDVIAQAPPGLRVHIHRTVATALTEDGGTQVVTLAEGAPLRVDSVVLASGHLDATPTDDECALRDRSRELGLRYLVPEQTTDSDLSVIAPGETVLARGLGLAFVDLVVLLFEGRGGRFEPDPDDPGRLRYLPSGEEPRLVAGSPRGATYHSKTHYQLLGGRPPLPRFLTPDATDALIASAGGRGIDMTTQVWPLMAKEIGWGWYHELVNGHPELVRLGWDEFAARYQGLDWDSDGMRELIEAAVPDPLDRLDLNALDRPLDGLHAPDMAALQPLVRARIAEDLRQHVEPRHTPHLGAFVAMLSVYSETTRLSGSGVLSARSRASDMPWWQSFFNAVASGPPGFRVRQMLALSRAGFVEFLGAGMRVDVDAPAGEPGAQGSGAAGSGAQDSGALFRATSATLGGADTVTSTVLVDARLPDPSVARSTDALISSLAAAGDIVEDVLVDDDGAVLRNTGLITVRPGDGALVRSDGRVHPRRFAVGPHTTVKVAGAFTRPGMNAQSLRYNDAVARAVLESLPATPGSGRAGGAAATTAA